MNPNGGFPMNTASPVSTSMAPGTQPRQYMPGVDESLSNFDYANLDELDPSQGE
jgi:hypothetical protein